MRRRAALLAAGLLAGATISVSGGTPAHAQSTCTSTDPVLAWVCRTVGSAPQPGPTITHYYDEAGKLVYRVYCTVWPPC